MKFAAFVILLAATARPCSASPVEKVVQLLTDLQEKIKHDGANEKAIFENFACWCTGMTRKKGEAIQDAKTDLKKLGNDIMSLKSKIASCSAAIKDAAADMKENEEDQQKATETRQDENRAFNALNAEMSQALAALEKALTVLGESLKGSALLQSQALSSQTAQVVSAAVAKVPEEALGSLSAVMLSQLQNVGKAGYNPSYGSIAGILQELYKQVSKDYEKVTKDESTAFKDYEKLMSTKVEELTTLQEKVAKKEEEKADAGVDLAETVQNYESTEEAMKSDIEFFDEAVESCEKKEKEWADRKKLRASELAGVEKAIEILSSDEARALFAKAIQPGIQGIEFLQLDAMPSGQKKAFQVLKGLATNSQSLTLARVASQVRLAKGGHFGEVMKAIDKVIGVLKDEQEDDIKKKDQCNEEYQGVAKKSADLEWKIEKNEAKIEKLETTIEKKEEEKAETIEKIDDVKEQIKEMDKVRKQENEDFKEAKKDDEDAIKLLTKAKDALLEYYKKNKLDGALAALIQGEPAFDRGDLAPDAKFSDKGKRSTQTKGIASLLANIISDLKGEINAGVANEKAAKEAYDKAKKAAQDLQKELEKKKTNLEKAIADRQKDKDDEEKDKKANEKDLKTEKDYKAEIKPDCDFILENFTDRAKKRKVEMDGLVTAKDFLAGAMKNDGAALVKVKTNLRRK